LKLLFDQNISPRIIKFLTTLYPEAKHVRQIKLEDASDQKIYEYAKRNLYTIVTFDSDFVDLNIVRGIPPKIIWLKTGNLTTRSVAQLLEENHELLKQFMDPDQIDIGILELIQKDF